MSLPPHPTGFLSAVTDHRHRTLTALVKSGEHKPAEQPKEFTAKPKKSDNVITTTNVPTPQMSYVDAPDLGFGTWLWGLGTNPIGTIGSGLTKGPVAIIGAGPSGTAAAYELSRAGVQVTVFEQSNDVGGRCNSVLMNGGNIVELGAMRFPGSEFIMSYYLNKFGLVEAGWNPTLGQNVYGIDMLPPFPDPGVVPTWVCWQGKTQQWIDNGSTPKPPTGFETVYYGWLALATTGITQGGKNVDFQNPSTLNALMRNPLAYANVVQGYWQNYITAFQAKTFYSVLQDLFTGKLISPISGQRCDIPGGKVWTFDDFDKFGTVGIGSGGFGALYPINFVEIYRLIVDGLEHQQRFFAKGIRSLSRALQVNSTSRASFIFNTGIRKIQGTIGTGFTLIDAKGAAKGPFSRVILATTTRSIECTTNAVDPMATYLTQRVGSAIRRTHVVSSVKVAARIKAFWTQGTGGSQLPRVMQCDTTPCQAYTLDYNVTDQGVRTGVCFITYTWDDDAVKEQGLVPLSQRYAQDPNGLYEFLRVSLSKLNIVVTSPYTNQSVNWADLLVAYPVNNDDPVRWIQWQSEPYFNGAFKLSQPGQDTYVQSMYWDYKKAGSGTPDTGVYVAGDCASWTSGWVEGGLQTGLNAACAIVASSGGRVNDARATASPWTAVNRYNYFAAPPFPPGMPTAVEPASSKKKSRAAAALEDDDEEPAIKKHTTETPAKTKGGKTTKVKA